MNLFMTEFYKRIFKGAGGIRHLKMDDKTCTSIV